MTISLISRRLTMLALSAAISLSSAATIAMDGTGGLVPNSLHKCELVAASVGQPTASPVASPAASPMATAIASPVVEPGTISTDLQAATHAILDCMSENNTEILQQVTGEKFRGSWLGFEDEVSNDDLELILPQMPKLPYQLVALDVTDSTDASAIATVQFTVGRQLHTAKWNYSLATVDGKRTWRVDQATDLPTETPAKAATVELTINDGSIAINEKTAKSGDVVLEISNDGKQPHEALIVRAPDGTEAADFAAAPTGLPEGSTFIGQFTIPAGESGEMVLIDLRPGTYTVVDLLPNEIGLPNVSDGMITTFIVKD